MLDLFSEEQPWQEPLAEGAVILRRRARDDAEALYQQILAIADQNPFAHRITPGGHRMSVAMTNCGDFGWSVDSRGYNYQQQDNLNGRKWPPMPPLFRELAQQAAAEAGFPGFNPDACLLNRYEPGAKLTLHGFERGDSTQRVLLEHGDIVVWGGPSRLRYHGILPLKPGVHPLAGAWRYNLTFRRAF